MTASLLPGQRLKEARQRMGLSEAEVARRLHLSTTFVKALEADDYDRLPEPAFIKGYLRNYARLVELPPDDLANLFQQIVAEDAPAEAPVRPVEAPLDSSRRPWPVYVAGAVALALLVFWVADQEPPARQDEAGVAEVPLADAPDTGAEDVPGLEETVVAGDVDAVSEPEPPAAVEPAAEPEPVAEPEPPAPARDDRLAIAFTDDCWVKVMDATGEEVYAGQKPAESRLLVQGAAPFRITLGNAAAVASISVNDTSVPVPAATPGRVRTLRAP